MSQVELETTGASIRIETGRWDVTIIVQSEEGETTYVVSADSFYTEGSGIWFGTLQEYIEAGS